jgi:hypothetical protein
VKKGTLLIKSRWKANHDRDSILFQKLVNKFYKDEGDGDEGDDDEEEEEEEDNDEWDDDEEDDEEERRFRWVCVSKPPRYQPSRIKYLHGFVNTALPSDQSQTYIKTS